MRRLNRYVEQRAPWQAREGRATAAELDRTLRALAEGLRVVTVLLTPYSPNRGMLLRALGDEERGLAGASTGAAPGGARVPLEPLFPKL